MSLFGLRERMLGLPAWCDGRGSDDRFETAVSAATVSNRSNVRQNVAGPGESIDERPTMTRMSITRILMLSLLPATLFLFDRPQALVASSALQPSATVIDPPPIDEAALVTRLVSMTQPTRGERAIIVFDPTYSPASRTVFGTSSIGAVSTRTSSSKTARR